MYIHVHVHIYILTCTYIHTYVHDILRKERKKERQKERHLRQWKNEKMRVASCGIRTHDTLYSRQMLYHVCNVLHSYIVHVHCMYTLLCTCIQTYIYIYWSTYVQM